MNIEYFNIEVAMNGYVLEYYVGINRKRKLFTTKEELLKELDLLLEN